jgi:predicted ABC-type ATPase
VPQVIIIAGPNGAGKTTFASEYLPTLQERFEFINADEIARGIARFHLGLSGRQVDLRSARVMLGQITALIGKRENFALETTLASRIYAQKIPLWRKSGYTVSLIYLRLATVEDALGRVRRRIEAGGHGIPEEVIRRRFSKSVEYFDNIYKSIVDDWHVRDSLEGRFGRAETSAMKDE